MSVHGWGDGLNFLITDRIRAKIRVRVERAGDGPWRRCITTPARTSGREYGMRVESAETLRGMPAGSVIRDYYGDEWRKVDSEFWEYLPDPDLHVHRSSEITLPATVVSGGGE